MNMNDEIFEIRLNDLKTVHDDPRHKWGKEYWLENNKRYNYSAKILQVNPGYRSSIHFHKTKSETFYLLAGEVRLEFNWKSLGGTQEPFATILAVGDSWCIDSGTIHRFQALERSLVLEVATYENEKTVKLVLSEVLEEKLKETDKGGCNMQMKKAVCFLDRDGVITKNDQSDHDGAFYITCGKDLRYRPGALEAIAKLRQADILVFLVTSQKWACLGLPEAAKEAAARKIGEIDLQFVNDVVASGGFICDSKYLIKENENKIDAIAELAQTYKVDLANAWMVGDSSGDIKAGKVNRCKTIYIQNEFAQSTDPGADYQCTSLKEAVEIILSIDSGVV